MRAQHPSNLLHRLKARAHGLGTPLVHELHGPGRRDVLPEQPELLLQEVGADGAQIAAQEFLELNLLPVGEVLRALQQAPARVGQDDPLAAAEGTDIGYPQHPRNSFIYSAFFPVVRSEQPVETAQRE
jgi:hypothetical protein